MSELKPCPFCGKKRHLRFEPFEGSTDTGIVVCICGASYTTIEQGADWNTRPIEDDLRKRIAELEALVERLIEAGNWTMTNELDEIRHLLEEFAMSIYPHGKTPVWNSVSDGVKDLIDYAKSLDDTENTE